MDGTPRERSLNPGPRPDPKLTPASSSASSTRPAPQVDRNGRAMLRESSRVRDYAPRSPVVHVDSPHASALRKGPALLSADPRIKDPEYRPTDSTSKLQPRASTTREAPPTLKTSSNGPSPLRNRDLTARSAERPSTTSGGSTTSTTSTRKAETSSGFTSPPSTQPTSRELSHGEKPCSGIFEVVLMQLISQKFIPWQFENRKSRLRNQSRALDDGSKRSALPTKSIGHSFWNSLVTRT